jgi:hypothetical protein
MKKVLTVLGATLAGLALFAPSAQGGPRQDPTPTIDANKALCKHACLNAARSCSGKRTTCAAQKQRCLKGCK